MSDDDTREFDVPEGFHGFDKGRRAFKQSEMAIRLRASGNQSQFLLSPTADDFLGNPEAIRYFYNKELDQIAFAPTDADDPNGYTVGSRTLSADGILSALGVDTDENWYLKATEDDDRGWLLIDISEVRDGDE